MTDIFHEVEEDVRRERFEKLWKQYGDYAIALVAAVIIAVAGYKFWQRYEYQQRVTAATAYFGAQQAATGGKADEAAKAFANLVKTAPSGYAAISQLAEADALYAAGKTPEAVALYKQIASGTTALADVARIRAAWAIVETESKTNVEALLAPLTVSTSAYRPMAREILAYADYRAGASEQAQKEFQAIASDPGVSESTRGRANAMAIFLKAGGDRDFGTVPRPPAPAPETAQQGQPSP